MYNFNSTKSFMSNALQKRHNHLIIPLINSNYLPRWVRIPAQHLKFYLRLKLKNYYCEVVLTPRLRHPCPMLDVKSTVLFIPFLVCTSNCMIQTLWKLQKQKSKMETRYNLIRVGGSRSRDSHGLTTYYTDAFQVPNTLFPFKTRFFYIRKDFLRY